MKVDWSVLHVARIVGRKPFLAFAAVTFLIVFLLSAVNITSHYAMARYVEDQIKRVPWDFSVYQTAEVPLFKKMHDEISESDGIKQAEAVFFLRSVFPKSVAAVIDGGILYAPWVSMLTASTPELLPAEMRPSGKGAVLVLVGSKAQMGNAYLNLQGHERFSLSLVRKPEAGQASVSGRPSLIPVASVPPLSVPIEKTIRMDGSEINRWFLENTSSPSLIPELGLIIVLPFHPGAIIAFDALARGGGVLLDDGLIHSTESSEYFPDVIHLARSERDKLVSPWDVIGSSARLNKIGAVMQSDVRALSYSAAVDDTLGVMFKRIAGIARQIGLISLLVSIPLLCMAWVLLANVCGLLLMNQRRNFGLMRLRGVPSALIGRTLMLSITAGGLAGGVLGALFGTVIPVLYYAGGWLPMPVLLQVQNPIYVLLFLAVALAMALAVSRKFIRFAATISPLAASGRVSAVESGSGTVRFGLLQFIALAIGTYKVMAWIGGWTLASAASPTWMLTLERAGDYVAFPLFVYGLITLVASRRRLIRALLAPTVWIVGGSMHSFSLRHMQLSQHRTAAFLLIVGLMTSLCLYPTVMSAVFDNKTERAARVQLGGEVQVTLDALDLVPPAAQARGALRDRAAVLTEGLGPIVEKIRKLPSVQRADYVVEGLVEGLYMPGRGFSGIPLYLIGTPDGYLNAVYHETALGINAPFSGLVRQTGEGKVLLSESVAAFYKRKPGEKMPVGADAARKITYAPLAGTIRFLPGMPLRTVNDREGFLDARIDYINYLFGENPYIVGNLTQKNLAGLDVLMPRVVIAVHGTGVKSIAAVKADLLGVLPVEPLEVRTIDEEIAHLGSDMYIFLARENVRIYLIGGLILALVGILAVAAANYADNKRTLGLLRVRGCGPKELFRFFSPGIFAPSLVGFVLGAGVALIVGFGITNVIWNLREIQTVMNYLSTHLVVSWITVLVAAALLTIIGLVALVFSTWVYRRTAREGLSDI